MTEQTDQSQETQGKTTNPMDNQQENTEKITKDKDGFTQAWDTVGAGKNPMRRELNPRGAYRSHDEVKR